MTNNAGGTDSLYHPDRYPHLPSEVRYFKPNKETGDIEFIGELDKVGEEIVIRYIARSGAPGSTNVARTDLEGLRYISRGKSTWRKLATLLWLVGYEGRPFIVLGRKGLFTRGYIRNYAHFEEGSDKPIFDDEAPKVPTWEPWQLEQVKSVAGKAYPIPGEQVANAA